jgi:hypothetical protein
MLVRHARPFNVGVLLAISFAAVLVLIFSPVFGGGKNGLEYSDDLFNKLSKGSSYFIPDIAKKVDKFKGKTFDVTVKLDNPADVEKAVKIFIGAGAQVGATDNALKISGDLGKTLSNLITDSDAMYKNHDSEVTARYGIDGKEVMVLWHGVFTKSIKELQKAKSIDEANIISDVLKKAVEPAYNFYGIEAQSVMDKAALMTSLLVFYVAYTMWWGYAIFYMFEGIGLSMKKAKVKKEV